MIDGKKVVKGLKEMSDCYFDLYRKTQGCVSSRAKKFCDTAEDALELLKDQEPMLPIIDEKVFQYARCGKCKQVLHWQGNYCHWCGQAVKWE